MTNQSGAKIQLVCPWTATWHSGDNGPSGRGMCGWNHTDDDRPQARWTMVVEHPNGTRPASAMCDECLAHCITNLYGEPKKWRRT